MILTLTARPSDEYTQGILRVGDTTFPSIERPWVHTSSHRGGMSEVSCVPEARYRLVPHDSHRFGKTWALVNEDVDVYHYPQDDKPGRYAVLIHAANRASDLQGCVGIGMDAAPGWVGSSQKAMRVLRSILPWAEHTLDVIRYPNRRGTL